MAVSPSACPDFVRRLELRFPSVAAALDSDERSLLHLGMAAFARATRAAIAAGQESVFLDHFGFADELLQNASPELENAVVVSYLENVFLGDTEIPVERARLKLPLRLEGALSQLERHFRRLDRHEEKGT